MDTTSHLPSDFTVLVVSDHAQAVKRFRVRRRSIRAVLYAAAAGLTLVLALAAAGTRGFAVAATAAARNRALQEENAELRGQMRAVRERVAHIAATLDRVEQADAKLRTDVVQLQGSSRKLPVGPVSTRADVRKAIDDDELPSTLETLAGAAARQESSLKEMQGYFEQQRQLLASTPSTWPARGWVTSDFGSRVDPYTAERVMHHGMDIATPEGQPVRSPSDGTISFAGVEGGYGKVVIVDHGYGVKTRYGHLKDIFVKAGERVRRGARIAAVGNTGRSTGPHLHYEVRVNGIPENPRKFILE